MSARGLVVCLEGIQVGTVRQDAHGRLKFKYSKSWQDADERYPLSLSMPLQIAEHPHARIEAFLWGLLPDNALVLRSWASRFQVSARNAFALIAHVGEDCAGAVQFIRPERLAVLEQGKGGPIAWLTEADVEQRLRALRADHAAWRAASDVGQFSLAGAQPKTALLLEKGKWGIPSGRTPTTHILKPPNPHFVGFPENEHMSLALARSLGLSTAASSVMRFGEEIAIVVERYDRVRTPAGWMRVHQEDLCQALGINPAKKYQSDGGPDARMIVDFLRVQSSSSEEDVAAFVGALVFNWLIAGTDAHARNYSVLIASRGRARLAPLYDLASVLPYPQLDPQRVKLAMKTGGKYRLRDVGMREWRKLAGDLRIDGDALLSRIATMAQSAPDLIADAAARARSDGLAQSVVDRWSDRLTGRARLCLKGMNAGRRV